MIIETMKHFDIQNPLSVLKIDDTYIGLEEGKRAGGITLSRARLMPSFKIETRVLT